MDSIGMTTGGKSTTYTSASTPVVLDSGSSLSYLPQSVVSRMASDLGARYDSSSQLYLVPCSKRTATDSFDFAFSGFTLRVPFNEFIWNVDGRNCVLGAEPVDPSSGITVLLGDTFMRSAFAVFDQTSNAIYMAPYVNCGQNEQAIPAGNGAVGNFSGECDASQAGGSGKNAAGRVGGGSVGLAAVAVAAGVVGVQALLAIH